MCFRNTPYFQVPCYNCNIGKCHLTIATLAYLSSQPMNIQAPFGVKTTAVANLCTSFQCFSKLCLSYHPVIGGFGETGRLVRHSSLKTTPFYVSEQLETFIDRQFKRTFFQLSGCNSGSNYFGGKPGIRSS